MRGGGEGGRGGRKGDGSGARLWGVIEAQEAQEGGVALGVEVHWTQLGSLRWEEGGDDEVGGVWVGTGGRVG